METQDIAQFERKAGQTASIILTASLRSHIGSTFKRRTGAMAKTNVKPRYKDGRLDRLIINSPHYSFKHHFGSVKKGKTMSTRRRESQIKAFTRHIGSVTIAVKAHKRKGGHVSSHVKNIDYKATNHIAKSLQTTNALENLATTLAENRAVLITSQIDF